jgi:hypothetical protein
MEPPEPARERERGIVRHHPAAAPQDFIDLAIRLALARLNEARQHASQQGSSWQSGRRLRGKSGSGDCDRRGHVILRVKIAM